MRSRVLLLIFGIYCSSVVVFGQKTYLIQDIELKDKRIEKAIAEYTASNEFGNIEGAVILKFDKGDPDCFYLGYIVYKAGLTDDPPSYYAILNRKLVLIYTGFEHYITYTAASFKKLLRDSHGMFPPEGGLIVEPAYWQFVLMGEEFEKTDILRLPY